MNFLDSGFLFTSHFFSNSAYETLGDLDKACFDFYIANTATQFAQSEFLKMLYEVLEKFSQVKAEEIISKRPKHTFQKYLFKNLLMKFSRDPVKQKSQEILSDYENYITKLLATECEISDLEVTDVLLKGYQ